MNRRAAAALLAVESGLGAVWVAAMLARPDLGTVFLPAGTDPLLLHSFVAADVAAYVLAPALAAAALARARPWAAPLLWAHCGAVVYAALWGWGLFAVTGAGVAGAALMTPSAVVFPWIAWRLRTSGGDAAP